VRLLLLSGTGGAGASTIAQATALQAVADGARVQLIDLGNVREASVARASAAQWLSALAADVLILRDSERVLPEELPILPGIDEFLALAAITECVTDPEIDFAVVDVGSLGQLARLLMTIDTLDLLAAALMTPAMAVVRDDVDAPLSQLRHELQRIRECLQGADTAIRLVSLPDDRGIPELETAVLIASLYGVAVDLIYINQVPREKDDWPKSWAASRRRRAQAIAEGSLPIPTRILPLREQQGDAVVTRLRVVKKTRPVWSEHAPRKPEGIESTENGFTWSIPVHIPSRGDVRIGRTDDRVIIDIDGVTRVRELPSVLRRCVITRAVATPTALTIELVPDPDVWRSNG
jgi:arsenite-transporting ATPase